MAKGFEKLVERVSQKTNYDVIFRWEVAEAGRDTKRERYLDQFVRRAGGQRDHSGHK
jgi:hypothetical protein